MSTEDEKPRSAEAPENITIVKDSESDSITPEKRDARKFLGDNDTGHREPTTQEIRAAADILRAEFNREMFKTKRMPDEKKIVEWPAVDYPGPRAGEATDILERKLAQEVFKTPQVPAGNIVSMPEMPKNEAAEALAHKLARELVNTPEMPNKKGEVTNETDE